MDLYEKMGGRTPLLQLLHHFYADVRQHRVLGPIFNAQIHDWHAHLEKIADFWSPALGGPSNYSGPMPMKHIPLGLHEEHFQAWLGLWEHNCRAWTAPECARALIARAHYIAARLREFCGLPTPMGQLRFAQVA